MSKKIAGRSLELENKLCEIFDIDPSKTYKISIIVGAGEIAKVLVEHHLLQSEVGDLMTLLSKHEDDFKVETIKSMRSTRRKS